MARTKLTDWRCAAWRPAFVFSSRRQSCQRNQERSCAGSGVHFVCASFPCGRPSMMARACGATEEQLQRSLGNTANQDQIPMLRSRWATSDRSKKCASLGAVSARDIVACAAAGVVHEIRCWCLGETASLILPPLRRYGTRSERMRCSATGVEPITPPSPPRIGGGTSSQDFLDPTLPQPEKGSPTMRHQRRVAWVAGGCCVLAQHSKQAPRGETGVSRGTYGPHRLRALDGV